MADSVRERSRPCRECTWYVPRGPGQGLCLANPPSVVTYTANYESESEYPIVLAWASCRLWERARPEDWRPASPASDKGGER